MQTALLAGTVAGTALCLAPFSALALTPQQAWETWRAQAAEAGATIETEGESLSGGTLTVSGVAFSYAFDDGTLSGTVEEILLSDAGGGAVTVTMSETIPMTISGTGSEGSSYEAGMTLSAPGLVYTATDREGGGTAASYEAPSITLVLDSVMEDGEPQDVAMTASGVDVTGTYSVTADTPATIENTLGAGQITFDLAFADPEEGDVTMALALADFETDFSSNGGLVFMDATDLESFVGSDAESSYSARNGPATLDFAFNDGGESLDLALSLGGGTASSSIDGERLEYGVTYDQVDFTASGSEIAVPQVTGSLDSWVTEITMPVAEGEEAAPASFLFALRDLALGEEIWSLVDPSAELPRDPATLIVDMAAQVRVLQNIFGGAFEATGEMPAEVERITLNEFLLTLAGTALSGTGVVALDYDTPGPFGPGTPAPDGTINLVLTGGNTLLDTLVGMGLVTSDNAMMARMMTGMLAVPGDGPDTLVSEITLRPDGTILANGAPLPF